MKLLYVFCAPPAAGKTTKAKQLEAEGYVRVSGDDQGKEHMNVFKNALEAGKDIVIDRMGFDSKQRLRFIEPARAAGYTIHIEELRVPKKISLARALTRESHPTVKTTEDANNAVNCFFGNYERPLPLEYDTYTIVDWGIIKEKAIYSDLDNTLTDASHREHFLEKKDGKRGNWKAFFDNMDKDPCNEWCKETLRVFRNAGYKIVLASGRPDSHREVTVKWLEDNGIVYDELLMRQRNDSRRDDIVKEMIYLYDIETQYDVLLALDDRDQVVKKLRGMGVRVLQCQEGAF